MALRKILTSEDKALYKRCRDSKTVFVAWEIYERGLTNQAPAARIKGFGLRREKVTCDSAEPKSIEELRSAGINAVPATKGQDSVRYGIQWLQGVHIVVHPD